MKTDAESADVTMSILNGTATWPASNTSLAEATQTITNEWAEYTIEYTADSVNDIVVSKYTA